MDDKLFFLQGDIISFLLEPQFEGVLLLIKTIFIVASVLLIIAVIIFSLVKSTWLKKFILEDLAEVLTMTPYGAEKAFKEWAKIKQRIDTGKEEEYKLALIEADSLLDDILKRIGYQGESISDRLKQIDLMILPNIEQVWEVHKVRNNIIHDPDYRLTFDVAKKALAIYEKVFQDLEAF